MQATLISVLAIYFCFIASIYGQDTIQTKYPETEQVWEKIFVDGQKVEENVYHENGAPWMTFQYEKGSTEKYKWYYDNGQPFFDATNIEGQLQGRYRVWYENGQLAEDLNFIDNLENGSAAFYHPNGQLAMSGRYRSGNMMGDWQFFDEDGSPANGDWEWKFGALPELLRMRGELNKGKATGEWKYRRTASLNADQERKINWDRKR